MSEAAQSLSQTIPEQGSAKRILVVDDSVEVRDVVRKFVENSGYAVCGEAANGTEAVKKARELKPDLIVMDLVMPQMNGIEAASLIRKTMPRVPIVAFTMYESLANSMRSNLAISSVVSKPDGLSGLVSCINSLLDSSSKFIPDEA